MACFSERPGGPAPPAPPAPPPGGGGPPPPPPPPPLKQTRVTEIAPEPPAGDRDHDRIVRMQTALREILHDSALRRTRVGMRVMEARTGRLLFETRGT